MRISVIIPTFNEAKYIEQTCNRIREFGTENLVEIIVADSPKSTDKTYEIALNMGLKAIKSPTAGRAAQMNFAAEIAKGDVLYFVHADTQIHPDFMSDIQHSFQNNYHLGCYRYIFDSSSFLLKINAFFTRFPFIWCRGGDQTLFIQKKDFVLLNGFREDFLIMEDYDFIIRAKQKFRFRIIPKNVVVSARKYQKNSYLKVQKANFLVMQMFLSKKYSQSIMAETYKKLINN